MSKNLKTTTIHVLACICMPQKYYGIEMELKITRDYLRKLKQSKTGLENEAKLQSSSSFLHSSLFLLLNSLFLSPCKTWTSLSLLQCSWPKMALGRPRNHSNNSSLSPCCKSQGSFNAITITLNKIRQHVISSHPICPLVFIWSQNIPSLRVLAGHHTI